MKNNNIPQLTRREALDAKPLKNPKVQWEKKESGEVRISFSIKKKGLTKFLSGIFHIPDKKNLSLDEIGSKVWLLCDGEKKVEEIIQTLCKDLSMNRKEMETSLLQYLKTLGSKGLVGLAVPDKK